MNGEPPTPPLTPATLTPARLTPATLFPVTGAHAEPTPAGLPSLEHVLKLFDETTAALASQVRRLEEILTRKQAELVTANAALADKVRQLDQVTSWLELILASVASGVIAIDTHAEITTANNAGISMLMGVLPDPVGSDYRRAFPDSPLLAVLATGRPQRYERRISAGPAMGGTGRIPEGVRLLACSGAPVRGPDGGIIGAVEVFEDITELRHLREVAERADRLKQIGELAAGVAHEIRNPLNGIGGFAGLLAREFAAGGDERDRRCHRYADKIVSGVRDLNAIVTGLLEFTRPRPAQRRACDPAAILSDALDAIASDVPTGVTVVRELHWPGGTVPCDPGQIRQVLINLVLNAVHAISESDRATGTVTVTVSPTEFEPPHGVIFAVTDDGPGINPDIRPRLFTPFVTSRDHGTGLGLAICHVLIQGHSGSITVSDAPAGGATFTVELPGVIPV